MALQQPLQIGRPSRAEVSITRSARSRKGETRWRSRRMPSATGRSPAQRMAPPRLGIAAPQQLVVAIEKDERGGRARCSPRSAVERGEQRRRRRNRGSACRCRWRAAGAAPRRAPDERGQQRQRQVVDRLVADILERLERGRAAGARHAGDEEHAAPARRRLRGRRRRGAAGCAASSCRSVMTRGIVRRPSSAQRQAQLRRRRGLERGKPSSGKAMAEDSRQLAAPAAARHRPPGTRSTTRRSGAAATAATRQDADAADLEAARRCAAGAEP